MMSKYLLDLSAFYSDHRQKAYIGYRTTWSTVGCVIRTIQDTFNIQSELYICSEDGIFYPECENVNLIDDGETLRILPKVQVESRQRSCTVSDDEPCKRTAPSIQQESSAYEDIESVLLGLPKPKRRRVRKRKGKRSEEEQQPSQPVQRTHVKQSTVKTNQNDHVRFPEEESQSSEEKPVDEAELPYMNLNRTMKARVVRAVSPSTLTSQQTCDNISEPVLAANIESKSTTVSNGTSSNNPIKPRIVRALGAENTVEVKREQLEANHVKAALLQQSYQPQTAEENIPIIEIDSQPTPVHGEEGTSSDTAIPAV
uniref:Coilin_N domain-containing protein n=1 Tax=Anopheles christyi TaxID=43041 RepID=A0A182K533_9DIPT